MRITSEVLVNRSLDRLHTRLQAYERAQSQLGTGRRIVKPSDDPAGARRALGLQAAIKAREQDLANASDAQGWLNAADSQLQSANSQLQRLQVLVTRASSNANEQEREALAAEIRDISDSLVAIGNHRHFDRPLFGGFTSGDAVEYDEGTATWVSNGGGDQVTRRVSDSELVQINVTAADWMGFTEGDDLPTLLANIADDIANDAPGAQISGYLADIKTAQSRVGHALSSIGAATNRVDAAQARATDLQLTLRTELSEVQDVDLAEGLMEQQIQQVGYEATLQALAQALPPSLVAFLR